MMVIDSDADKACSLHHEVNCSLDLAVKQNHKAAIVELL